MALLTAVPVSRAGILAVSDGVLPTVTTGDTWLNTGAELVVISNGSGGAMTVTLDIKATVDGAAAVDRTVTIADGGVQIIGPFPVGQYNDTLALGGVAKVTCAPVTSSKIKIIGQVINQ